MNTINLLHYTQTTIVRYNIQWRKSIYLQEKFPPSEKCIGNNYVKGNNIRVFKCLCNTLQTIITSDANCITGFNRLVHEKKNYSVRKKCCVVEHSNK